MKQKKNKPTVNWMAIGHELINCLGTKDRHRLSRYDAFVWLMESIGKGVPVHNEQGEQIHVLPFSASYMRLAEEWNWDRHTVQQFLDELTGLSVISRQREGNTYVFSLAKKSHKHLLL